uniref:Uncharacterized protein n=1 Tax=Solanum lycopersicum TaxID=4081 RepID=A0A3Q7J6S7_SOLLC
MLRIVKEDVRKLRESRKRKKKEKPKGFLCEVGFDEGYEDVEKGKKNFKGKLTEDELYYDSSDCDSFQSDEEEPSTTGKKRGRGHYERTSTSKTGTRRGAGSGYKKRPKVVGQGVFVADTGYTCINQGLSSRRRVNTGVTWRMRINWATLVVACMRRNVGQ